MGRQSGWEDGGSTGQSLFRAFLGHSMTTILIVEDEAAIRRIGAEVLMDAGYEVVEAIDASQAMRVLEGRGDIDLVFTDIRMPGAIDGLQLAGMVARTWPAIRLLLTSGHARLGEAELPAASQFLAKPYRCVELEDRIAHLLGTMH